MKNKYEKVSSNESNEKYQNLKGVILKELGQNLSFSVNVFRYV